MLNRENNRADCQLNVSRIRTYQCTFSLTLSLSLHPLIKQTIGRLLRLFILEGGVWETANDPTRKPASAANLITGPVARASGM